MKKIGKIIVFLFALYSSLLTFAQEFRAVAPTVVGVSEQFKITFTASGSNPSDFKAPSFNGLEVLSGPNQSRSSSISNINGNVTSTSSVSFSYYLQASKTGTYTIPSAMINIDGKTVTSKSLTIKVQSNPTQSQRSQMQGQAQTQRPQQERVTVLDDKALFLRASANKTKVVKGEEVIITYKIYTLVPISEYQVNKMPINKGFWIEELDMSKDPIISEEVIDGKRYQVATLRKVLAYPQQSGKLNIASLDIDVVAMMQVRQQRRVSTGDPFFDSFFNDPFFQSASQIGYERVKKNIRSNQITLDVSELPATTKNYCGAVGDFKISASVSSEKGKTNEPITLRYTISGSGNLSLIDKVDIKIPADFDSYDPRIEDNLQKTHSGLSGSRTFEYILIPRIQGEFTLPKVEFTYYDLKTKQYKTISSQEFKLDIAKGNDDVSAYAEQLSEREKYRIRDIDFISTKHFNAYSISDMMFGKAHLLILLILLPLLTFIFIVLRNKLAAKNADVTYVRFKKANKVAMKRLKKADNYLKNNQKDEFYTEIAQALWDYLSDKFKIKKMELSFDNVQEVLKEREFEQSVINQLIDLLGTCEYVRFSQVEEDSKMDNLYQHTLDTITKLEAQRK